MRRLVLGAAVMGVLASGVLSVPAEGAIEVRRDIKPTLDEVVMIHGPENQSGTWDAYNLADTKHHHGGDGCERQPQITCFEYGVEVPADNGDEGWRLRVAIDAVGGDLADNDLADKWWLELYDPDGDFAAEHFPVASPEGGGFEVGEVMVWPEARSEHTVFAFDRVPQDVRLDAPWSADRIPEPGRWTIRVLPLDVTEASFRVRVVLESLKGALDKQPSTGTLLLPDMRPEPPYGLTFDHPGTGTGCSAAETAEGGSVRCLRFNFGYHNTGDGPYEVQLTPRLAPSTEDVPRRATADVRQRVYIQDSTPFEHRDNVGSGAYRDGAVGSAGTATFHEMPGHMHWHYDEIFQLELYRVTNDRKLGPAPISAAKFGACAHDWVMADFERVFQDERRRYDSGQRCDVIQPHANLPTNQEIAIALSVGWGDIYFVVTPDNYVRFDHKNPEGEYVMQNVVNVNGLLEEKNKRDNVGYTYFRVSNCTQTRCKVELLERGRGEHPWDPNKIKLRGLGQ